MNTRLNSLEEMRKIPGLPEDLEQSIVEILLYENDRILLEKSKQELLSEGNPKENEDELKLISKLIKENKISQDKKLYELSIDAFVMGEKNNKDTWYVSLNKLSAPLLGLSGTLFDAVTRQSDLKEYVFSLAIQSIKLKENDNVINYLKFISQMPSTAIEEWNNKIRKLEKSISPLQVKANQNQITDLGKVYQGMAAFQAAPPDQEVLKLKNMIDNYENIDIKGNEEKIESPEESHKKVLELIGEEGLKALYKGIGNGPEITTARKKFINKLAMISTDKSVEFSGKIENRLTKPRDCAVEFKKLFGVDGLHDYKEAIKEERNSRVFRDAVFLSCLAKFPGKTWEERLVLWIGGSSGVGKSFIVPQLIEKLNNDIMTSSTLNDGNLVISVDGGKEREVSQMRSYAAQMAQIKGFTGIKDLHEKTKLRLKDLVGEAALSHPKINLVIPDTFSDPDKLGKNSKIGTYADLPNTLEVFGEVKGEKGKGKRFQTTTGIGGRMRSWAKNFTPEYLKSLKLIANKRKLGFESKDYEPAYFRVGQAGTWLAKRKYRNEMNAKSKPPILIKARSDNVFVLYDKKKNQWKKCGRDYSGTEAVRISNKDFKKWLNPKTKMPEALRHSNNLVAWLETVKATGFEIKAEKELAKPVDKPKLTPANKEKLFAVVTDLFIKLLEETSEYFKQNQTIRESVRNPGRLGMFSVAGAGGFGMSPEIKPNVKLQEITKRIQEAIAADQIGIPQGVIRTNPMTSADFHAKYKDIDNASTSGGSGLETDYLVKEGSDLPVDNYTINYLVAVEPTATKVPTINVVAQLKNAPSYIEHLSAEGKYSITVGRLPTNAVEQSVGTAGDKIPSNEYLTYADKQVHSFIAKAGSEKVIHIKFTDNKLLAESYVLICEANNLRYECAPGLSIAKPSLAAIGAIQDMMKNKILLTKPIVKIQKELEALKQLDLTTFNPTTREDIRAKDILSNLKKSKNYAVSTEEVAELYELLGNKQAPGKPSVSPSRRSVM